MPQVALIHPGPTGPYLASLGGAPARSGSAGTSVGEMNPVSHPSPTALAEADASWLRFRRGELVHRLGSHDLAIAVSSGCAANSAARHAGVLQAQAARALERLLVGLAETCEECGGPIPRERLDAVLTATRCVPCAGSDTVDTRWRR